MSCATILEKAAAAPRTLTRGELAALIDWPDLDALFKAAYAVKLREIGPRVSLRGLVEFGNVCEKDCLYCGIRKSNANVRRYRMTADEIVAAAKRAKDAGYGSVVLQSGELTSEASVNRSTHIVRDLDTGRILFITPVEAERLQHFPDNWTNTGMPEKRRYFMMGNALVTYIIGRCEPYISEITKAED